MLQQPKSMSKDNKKDLNSVAMNALRTLCRIPKKNRILHKKTRKITDVYDTVNDVIQRKQLVWYSHVKKLFKNRITKITLK